MISKRFYKEAAAVENGAGFGITLDGRLLRSPAKADFVVPTASLARAIAAEWAAQEDGIDPASMPLTQIASTSIDRVGNNTAPTLDALIGYAASDLLCYRAQEPESLRARQREVWQPVLDWAALHYDAPLVVTSGIMPVEQPSASLLALRNAVEDWNKFSLAALLVLTTTSGSLVLALAVAANEIDVDQCVMVSQLDEQFQIERWGEEEDLSARCRNLSKEIHAAAHFLALLKA
ncbi:MAG: ATPase [Proteobacteria bacterium]|nr:ATPase [Pseudomonadota bacterium]